MNEIAEWYKKVIGEKATDMVIDDRSANTVYIGLGRTKTATSAAGRIIIRTKKTSNGYTANRLADGSTRFDKIFDNASDYSYVES